MQLVEIRNDPKIPTSEQKIRSIREAATRLRDNISGELRIRGIKNQEFVHGSRGMAQCSGSNHEF
jgi:hypothetical protein